MRAQSVADSPGVRRPPISASRQRTISSSFCNSDCRTASVGCAVNTGSMSSCRSCASTASGVKPACFSVARVSCRPPGWSPPSFNW
jgi:hypothetical protein